MGKLDENYEGNLHSMPNHSRLYFSAFAANLAYFSCGCSLSWTSPSLPKLTASDSWLPITQEQGSWAGSLLMLGGSVGALLACPSIDTFGRKLTFQVNTLLLLLGWIVLGSANSLEEICIGRFLQGIAVAIYFTTIPLYLGEISEKSLRAALASCSEIFISSGYMLEYTVGPFVSHTNLVYASCVIPLISLILFLWIPETPYYLLAKGRRHKAIKTLSWLRGNTHSTLLSEELLLIQSSINSVNESGSSLKDLFTTRGNLKALYLATGLLFFQQFSGINVVLFYAQPIFMKTGASFSSSISAMIIGAVQTVSACVTPPLVKRYGFKLPLLLSATGMAVAQGILGLYFYMESKKYDLSYFGLVPVSCLVLYIHVYCLGFGPVPWAIVGEFYSPNVKSIASSISTAFSFFLAFIITKFFTNLSDALGTFSAFWLFSVWCIIAYLFVLFLLPNTRGLSLMEVQDLLNDRVTVTTLIRNEPRISRKSYVQIPQQ